MRKRAHGGGAGVPAKRVKPEKPRPDFPLFPHATGRWAKKINGRFAFFGPWEDPTAALEMYLAQRDLLYAGRLPRTLSARAASGRGTLPQQARLAGDSGSASRSGGAGVGIQVRDLVNHFLTAKQRRVDAAEMGLRSFSEYYKTGGRLIKQFGAGRSVDDLDPDDFGRLRATLASTRGPVSLGNEIGRVRSVFKYAYEAGLVDKPMRFGPEFTKPPKRSVRLARQAKGPRMFEPGEIKELLAVTEDEAAKLLVSIDPLAAMAEADPEKLTALLRSVRTDNEALAAMLGDLGNLHGVAPKPGLVDPDESPAPAGEAVSRAGDVWALGDHRLMCGDSAAAADVDILLGGASIHLVNTDPPYNVKVEPRSNNAIAAGMSSFTATQAKDPSAGDQRRADVSRSPGKSKATHRQLRPKDRPLANDFVSDAEFDRLLAAWFGNMSRVLIPGGGFYIWGGYANCGNYPPALKAAAMYFSQAVIWVKEHPVLTRKDFMGNHEWCFYGWKEGAAHRFFGAANVPDTWSVKKVNPQSMVHLTEKPVELAARAIGYSSKQGENVLDLFGGSGSTLIACEQTGRKAHLMELDGLYCDVIVRRWQAFTGREALLAREVEPVEGTANNGTSKGKRTSAKKAPGVRRTFAEVAAERGVDVASSGTGTRTPAAGVVVVGATTKSKPTKPVESVPVGPEDS